MRKPAARLALGIAFAALSASAVCGEPGTPQVTREQRFGDWGYSCAQASDGHMHQVERCMISQLVVTDPRDRKVVLGLTVDFTDARDLPTFRARFSSRALRKAGIGVKVDEQADMRLPITDCDVQRCEAVGRMAPPVLKVWLSGKQARFAFVMEGGKQMVLPVSLNGFGPALEALRRHPGAGLAGGGKA